MPLANRNFDPLLISEKKDIEVCLDKPGIRTFLNEYNRYTIA